jgi:c-di-GMP-binding flagellar brake protein YcgR
MTASSDRRQYARLHIIFQAVARILNTSVQVLGSTVDLSQGGAFIISPSFSDFQVGDQTEIEFFLPPAFTGQEDTLILKGLGKVKRLDKDRLGIALEFQKELKTFEASRRYEN